MKYFLYMNNDIVNSIISQSEQGIISEIMIENENGEEKSVEKSTKVGALAKISSSFYKFIGAEAEASFETSNGNNNSEHRVSKEIIQKTLYDATYNIAYDYVKQLFDFSSNDEVGNYIEISRAFYLIDFGNMTSIFYSGGIIDFLKKIQENKIREIFNANIEEKHNREEQRKNKTQIKQKLDELIKDSNNNFDSISTIINVIKSVVPYERMLLSYDGYLIPLDDKYLRDDPKTFGFKYGGEMVCFGYITNIIGEDCKQTDDKNVFSSLQNSINDVLRMFLPTKEKNICIVNPIAIYYNNLEPQNDKKNKQVATR